MLNVRKSIGIIALSINWLLMPSFSFAQGNPEVGLRFIPQATSIRYATPVPIKDYLKLTPYYFRVRTAQGLGILYHPYKRWSIGADVLYSLQGGGYEERKTNLNYVKMPFLFGYNSLPHQGLFVQYNISGVSATILVSEKGLWETDTGFVSKQNKFKS